MIILTSGCVLVVVTHCIIARSNSWTVHNVYHVPELHEGRPTTDYKVSIHLLNWAAMNSVAGLYRLGSIVLLNTYFLFCSFRQAQMYIMSTYSVVEWSNYSVPQLIDVVA